MTEEQFKAFESSLPSLREFRQTLIARNIGVLTELKIRFGNGAKETIVKISNKGIAHD